MDIVERYLARATECEQEAKQILLPEIRKQLEHIAQQWRELAELRRRAVRD
jgi:hypothetical protein